MHFAVIRAHSVELKWWLLVLFILQYSIPSLVVKFRFCSTVKWKKRFLNFFSFTGYDDGSSIIDICASAQSGQHKWSWHEAGKMIEPCSDAWSSIVAEWLAFVQLYPISQAKLIYRLCWYSIICFWHLIASIGPDKFSWFCLIKAWISSYS